MILRTDIEIIFISENTNKLEGKVLALSARIVPIDNSSLYTRWVMLCSNIYKILRYECRGTSMAATEIAYILAAWQ